jgi:hypothetical protein
MAIFFDRNLSDYVSFHSNYYMMPWVRIGPYLIGMLLGYILAVRKGNSVRMGKVAATMLWLAAGVLVVVVVFGMYGRRDISPMVTVAYHSMHRNGLALALAWTIFACVKGYGGKCQCC